MRTPTVRRNASAKAALYAADRGERRSGTAPDAHFAALSLLASSIQTSRSLYRRVIGRVHVNGLDLLDDRPVRLARFLGLFPLRVGLEFLPGCVAGLVAGVG